MASREPSLDLGYDDSPLDPLEGWRKRATELRAEAEVHDELAANKREQARTYEGMALRYESEWGVNALHGQCAHVGSRPYEDCCGDCGERGIYCCDGGWNTRAGALVARYEQALRRVLRDRGERDKVFAEAVSALGLTSDEIREIDRGR